VIDVTAQFIRRSPRDGQYYLDRDDSLKIERVLDVKQLPLPLRQLVAPNCLYMTEQEVRQLLAGGSVSIRLQ